MILFDVLFIGASVVLIAELNQKVTDYITSRKY